MEGTDGLAIRECEGGCLLKLRVKPKALRDEVIGVQGSALKISVKAAPERGKANEAVCSLVARVLALAADRLSLASGEASRDKTVRIAGIGAAECRRRLLAATEGKG